MKSKRGTMLIIIVATIVLFAGAAGVAYMVTRRGAPAPASSTVQDKAVATYNLGEFLTNLADPGGTRYIRVVIELGLNDAKALKKLDAYNPPMRDAVLGVLRSKTYAQVQGADGMAALGAEIKQRLNSVLPNPWISQVYFTDFTVQ